ncbi:hypothetical protein CCP4SC76_1560007 [Gammaproteobacteria bacterium]
MGKDGQNTIGTWDILAKTSRPDVPLNGCNIIHTWIFIVANPPKTEKTLKLHHLGHGLDNPRATRTLSQTAYFQ